MFINLANELGPHSCNDWIGLRENLQETIVFLIKYFFSVDFPLNQSIDVSSSKKMAGCWIALSVSKDGRPFESQSVTALRSILDVARQPQPENRFERVGPRKITLGRTCFFGDFDWFCIFPLGNPA